VSQSWRRRTLRATIAPWDRGRDLGNRVPILAIPQQLEELFDHLLAKASAITDPFEQAFFVMVHIPYLRPFGDVNKRVSRLVCSFVGATMSMLSRLRSVIARAPSMMWLLAPRQPTT
jgi:hypothetical protein